MSILLKVPDMTRLKLPALCSCRGQNIETGERVSGRDLQEWFHCAECRSGEEAAWRAVVKASVAAFTAVLAGGVLSQAFFRGRSDQNAVMTLVLVVSVSVAMALFAIVRRSLRTKHSSGYLCPGFGVRVDALPPEATRMPPACSRCGGPHTPRL